MSRNLKVVMGIVVAIGTSMLLVDNINFDSENGLLTDDNLELSWDVPTENIDDSPLSNLAGYTIHCWNSADQQTATIVITDSQITSYEIDRLQPGSYQCAVSAIKVDGSQSALSNVVSRTVP